MDDGGKADEERVKKQVDQEFRKVNNCSKPKLTEEARRARSDGMKAFHRKTGKGTALGNAMARRSRKPK